MVSEIRVYFEGDKKLRPGFHGFFRNVVDAARERSIRFQLIAGGSGAVADFMKAIEDHPESFLILLVDSEGPAPDDPRDRLRDRRDWQPPSDVDRDQVHLMVQLMEAWFLADKEALATYYGRGFRQNRLPPNPRVEEIPKADVENGLKGASGETQKGEYHKTRHAPDLLSRIDPSLVCGAAPACKRLFDTLEGIIADASSGDN